MSFGSSSSVLLSLLVALTGSPLSADDKLSGQALVRALQQGGYNIYFRHAQTDWSNSDRVEKAGDWTSCDPSRIRQLSDAGRETARSIGESMRALGIPVDRVLASPYCRAVETAEKMDLGKPIETTTDVMNMRVAEYFGGREAIVKTARKLLATPPPPGTNTIIVAHGNVAREATPVYPGEAEGVVFRPDDDGFTFVGGLTPEQWSKLSAEMAQ